jgi:hypothetical protein
MVVMPTPPPTESQSSSEPSHALSAAASESQPTSVASIEGDSQRICARLAHARKPFHADRQLAGEACMPCSQFSTQLLETKHPERPKFSHIAAQLPLPPFSSSPSDAQPSGRRTPKSTPAIARNALVLPIAKRAYQV